MDDSTDPRSHLGGNRSAAVSRSVPEAEGIAAAAYHDIDPSAGGPFSRSCW